MRWLFAATTVVGFMVWGTPAQAQSLYVTPTVGPVVQYYTPYTYGSTSYYTYPNTGYVYSAPYAGTYVSPYYSGYTATYPYTYGYEYYTPYRAYRWSRW